MLEFSTENCTAYDGLRDQWKSAISAVDTSPLQMNLSVRADEDYFWLYRISYLWYGVLGYFITFVFGYLFSVTFEALNYGGKKKIYVDNNRNCINTDLFVPPLANYIKRQKDQTDLLNVVVSLLYVVRVLNLY